MKLAMLFPICALFTVFIFTGKKRITRNTLLFCTILTEFCGLLAQTINGFAVMPVHSAKAIVR